LAEEDWAWCCSRRAYWCIFS